MPHDLLQHCLPMLQLIKSFLFGNDVPLVTNVLPRKDLKKKAFDAGQSNDVILPLSQQTSVRDLISEQQTELDIINHEICQLRCTLSCLQDKAKHRRKQLARYRVAVAPQKNLPPEVLAEIFVHCLLESTLNIGVPPLSTGKEVATPWAIMRVCVRWRQVALGEPRLWNRLQVNYKSFSMNNLTKLAKTALSRSRNPSAIRLILSDVSSMEWSHILEDAINPVAALILPRHIQGLKELVIKGIPLEWMHFFFNIPPGQMKSLESVELDVRLTYTAFFKMPLSSHSAIFLSAPHLRKVTFTSDGYFVLRPHALLLPWAQLTEFRLKGILMNVYEARDALGLAHNLVYCEMALGLDQMKPVYIHGDAESATLPFLQSLTVQVTQTLLFSAFLSPLSLPALTKFDVLGCQAWPQQEVITLLNRSGCKLRSFSANSVPMDDVEPLLEHMPSLISLHLGFISALVFQRMSQGHLVPNLECLKCSAISLDSFIDYLENCLEKQSAAQISPVGLRDAEIIFRGKTGEKNAFRRFQDLRLSLRLRGRSIKLTNSYGCSIVDDP